MAIDKIQANAFADDAITSDKINLANNFAFTGTVSGTPSNLVLIKTITISDDTTVSFVNGASSVVLDGTYKVYKIIGTGITITEADGGYFNFNASIDGGSNYNVDKTNCGNVQNLSVSGDANVATFNQNATTVTVVCPDVDGNEANNQLNFEMNLYEPSSTANFKFARSFGTYKRTGQYSQKSDFITMMETTSAVNAIQFSLSNTNMDNGIISLYGVKS